MRTRGVHQRCPCHVHMDGLYSMMQHINAIIYFLICMHILICVHHGLLAVEAGGSRLT